MRIGIDVSGLGPGQRYTGMGEYAHQLIAHLVRIAPEHDYRLIGYPEDDLPDFGPGAQRVALPRRRLGRLSALASHQIALPRLAQQLQLDVLHIPWVHVRPSQPAIPWRTPCPLVVTLHDVIPLAYYRRYDPGSLPWRLAAFYALNLRLAARATRLITVSQHARQDIGRFTHIPLQRVAVIHNGVDFAPLRLPADQARARRGALGLPPRYLLYAGSYEPRKNLRGALLAYAEAVRSGLTPPLVMIVERESGHAAPLLAWARTLRLDDRLIFRHSLPQDDLRFIYAQASLFLFPSFYEGFGFPPLQAMRCGVPVIAARRASLPEILGDAAYYVDPGRPGQIAQAILTLLGDAPARRRLAAAGLAQAAGYTWPRAAAQTLAVYRQAAEVDSQRRLR